MKACKVCGTEKDHNNRCKPCRARSSRAYRAGYGNMMGMRARTTTRPPKFMLKKSEYKQFGY